MWARGAKASEKIRLVHETSNAQPILRGVTTPDMRARAIATVGFRTREAVRDDS